MAARLGSQGNLRRRDGHCEEPLRSLRDRSRVRVHDGTRRSSYEVPRIRRSHCCPSSQVKNRGRKLASVLSYKSLENEEGDLCVYRNHIAQREGRHERGALV